MVRAVLKDGVIVPVEPLPPEWREGLEVTVAEIEPAIGGDHWDELERLCADRTPEDERLMAEALAEQKAMAKEAMRRKWGL